MNAAKFRGLGLLALAGLALVPPGLRGYYNSPAREIILPEVIWAAATGGGTWVSELQITSNEPGTTVGARFYYGTAFRTVENLWSTSAQYQSVKFTNVLAALQARDPSFDYYGRVGALWLYTQDEAHRIRAQVRTVNGNFGKTFPGLTLADMYTANVDRALCIMDLIKSPAYRTFVGFFNATLGGAAMTVEMWVLDQNDQAVGGRIVMSFAPYEFRSFDPFAMAGATGASYDNCWLYVMPLTSGNPGADTAGLFCFGSSANNYTNDTFAHVAVPFH